ncbi:MAG TPA: hypothetical protein VFB63_28355 [Bryobacteraceae bacterium]|nr:hypothetical protein [Bryobacteraceae bacterium]
MSSSRLADFPFDLVRFKCRKCERRGRATLIERYGPDQNMVDLLAPPALAATKLAAG